MSVTMLLATDQDGPFTYDNPHTLAERCKDMKLGYVEYVWALTMELLSSLDQGNTSVVSSVLCI